MPFKVAISLVFTITLGVANAQLQEDAVWEKFNDLGDSLESLLSENQALRDEIAELRSQIAYLQDVNDVPLLVGMIDVPDTTGFMKATKSFNTAFDGLTAHVQITAGHHPPEEAVLKDPVAAWLEDVTSLNFEVCARDIFGLDDWHSKLSFQFLAFSDLSLHGVTAGIASAPYGTTGTNCMDVEFPMGTFQDQPHVQITASHRVSLGSTTAQECHDSVVYWVEGVSSEHFRACYEEDFYEDTRVHGSPIQFDWMAYDETDIPNFASEGGSVSTGESFTIEVKAYCQIVQFSEEYPCAPVVIATGNHKNLIGFIHNAINLYITYTTHEEFKVCFNEFQGSDNIHYDYHFDWLAFEKAC